MVTSLTHPVLRNNQTNGPAKALVSSGPRRPWGPNLLVGFVLAPESGTAAYVKFRTNSLYDTR